MHWFFSRVRETSGRETQGSLNVWQGTSRLKKWKPAGNIIATTGLSDQAKRVNSDYLIQKESHVHVIKV